MFLKSARNPPNKKTKTIHNDWFNPRLLTVMLHVCVTLVWHRSKLEHWTESSKCAMRWSIPRIVSARWDISRGYCRRAGSSSCHRYEGSEWSIHMNAKNKSSGLSGQYMIIGVQLAFLRALTTEGCRHASCAKKANWGSL